MEFPRADALLQKAIADRVFPGAAYGVWFRGEPSIHAIGRQTYDDEAPAVTPQSVFDIASLSKVVGTTALAMRLWQQKQLDLETRLCDFLPIDTAADSRKATITLKMLLAHTAGFSPYQRLFELPGVAVAEPGDANTLAMRACIEAPLERNPGEQAVYSDIGFILLGEALRIHCSADNLKTLFVESVSGPLRLENTLFLPKHHRSISPTCDWKWRRRVLQGEVQDENCALLGGIAGHAGLFSNCDDLLRFCASLLGSGGFFAKETVDSFSQRVAGSRALGWDTPSFASQSGRYFSIDTIGHLGYTGTSLWIDRAQQVAVVLLTNRVYTGPECRPLEDATAIQRVRPAFHDAVMEGLGIPEFRLGSKSPQ